MPEIKQRQAKNTITGIYSIKNPPKNIWVDGNIEILNQKSIAVVGSRHCTNYGRKWCEHFVKGLIEYNLVITSGMAVGIDSIAHNSALKYNGKTIAVLPSGFNNIFPKENVRLYEQIKENGGAIISEYPPDEKHNNKKFLERNRIVSGISIATLIIEASYRSGTSVTARLTKDEEKEVFCIPGSLDNSKSIGTNIMIQKGAKLVTSVKDIVSCYDFLHKTEIIEDYKLDNDDVDDEYKDIYDLILNSPVDINTIAKLTNMSISDVMSKITMLEIDGKVKRVGGNKFVRG